MKSSKQTRRWLTVAVLAATVGMSSVSFAAPEGSTGAENAVASPEMRTEVNSAKAVTTPSESNMSQSEMISTKGKKQSLEEKGLINNPALEVGPSVNADKTDAGALYVAETDQAVIDANVGKTVTKISLIGIPAEHEQKLINQLSTKIGDKVSLEKINEDVTALGNTGIFAQIKPIFTPVPEGVQLAYQLTANPIVENIQFNGNTVFSADYLARLMAIPKGSILNTVTVSQKIHDIETLYINQGYILAGVTGVSVDADGLLKVNIAEGIIEDVVIKGNKKTKDYVITRELRIIKGHPFNRYLAQRSLERLYNLGYFEDVNVRLLPGKEPHSVIVEIDVLEQKTGVITLGAGYSKSDGFVGIVEFGENNFRGTGDKINIHWEFGGSGHGRNYQVSYTRPWLDSKGTSLGFSFYDRVVEYNDYNENGNSVATYDKRRKGYSLTLGRAHGEYRTTYVAWESRKDQYKEYLSGYNYNAGPFAAMDYVGKNFGRTNSLSLTHIFDNRDNYFNPSRGYRYSVTGQWAGHGLGGDFDFWKVSTEGRFYKKVGSRQVLALRLIGGYANGEVSYSELFSLGGANNLRGFEDDQFKGTSMYSATLEYRFPIIKKVDGVVFSDVGNAWNIDKSRIPWYNENNKVHWSVGVGLRLQTPIGPIRLDYAHGDKNKFHFSFGGQF